MEWLLTSRNVDKLQQWFKVVALYIYYGMFKWPKEYMSLTLKELKRTLKHKIKIKELKLGTEHLPEICSDSNIKYIRTQLYLI
jgi:hypothetical protein